MCRIVKNRRDILLYLGVLQIKERQWDILEEIWCISSEMCQGPQDESGDGNTCVGFKTFFMVTS